LPLLLCDLDDTLVDRGAAFARWAAEFAARHGQDEAFAEWLAEIDGAGFGPRPEFFVRIHEQLGSTQTLDEFVADYYRAFLPQFRSDDDVRAALASARARGWCIAIVTNGPETQLDKIRHAGLEELVDVWCVSAIEGHRKPDARLLEIAAERCDLALDGAWMIGDNPDSDIAAAHAAGIRSVWLRRGRSWLREDFAPTYEADSFAEAVERAMRDG
jgi:putative hydrolase of the HAD superfamily